MDISKVQESYRFSFTPEVPTGLQVNLMCEALLLLLHAALPPEGRLLRKSNLSTGFAFEVYDTDYGYRINIYKKD